MLVIFFGETLYFRISILGPTDLPELVPILIPNFHSYCVHLICMWVHTHTHTHTLIHIGPQRMMHSPTCMFFPCSLSLDCPSPFPLPHEICMFSRPCPDINCKACPDIPLRILSFKLLENQCIYHLILTEIFFTLH